MLIIVQMMKISHPTVMSNMLDPTELETAMSPRPFRATMTLVMRSGMEVPAARIVKPMISSVIPIVSPTCGRNLHKNQPQFPLKFCLKILHSFIMTITLVALQVTIVIFQNYFSTKPHCLGQITTILCGKCKEM